MPDRQIDGLQGQSVQLAHRTEGGIAHIESSFHQITEFQQAHAQSVGPCGGTIDETACDQIVEDAMCCRRMQLAALTDQLQGQRVAGLRQHIQHIEGALQNLDSWGRIIGGLHG